MINWLKTVGMHALYGFIAGFTASVVTAGVKDLETWGALEHVLVGGVAAGAIAALKINESWATKAEGNSKA